MTDLPSEASGAQAIDFASEELVAFEVAVEEAHAVDIALAAELNSKSDDADLRSVRAFKAARNLGRSVFMQSEIRALPVEQHVALTKALKIRLASRNNPPTLMLHEQEPRVKTTADYYREYLEEVSPVAEAIKKAKATGENEDVMTLVFERGVDRLGYNRIASYDITGVGINGGYIVLKTAEYATDPAIGERKLLGFSQKNDLEFEFNSISPNNRHYYTMKREYILKPEDLTHDLFVKVVAGSCVDPRYTSLIDVQPASYVMLGPDVIRTFIEELGRTPVDASSYELLERMIGYDGRDEIDIQRHLIDMFPDITSKILGLRNPNLTLF